jgi:hypothetical protein
MLGMLGTLGATMTQLVEERITDPERKANGQGAQP